MFGRISRAFRTRPSARDWGEVLFALAAIAALAAVLAWFTGFVDWAPREPMQIALIALRAFLIPALGEELVFRAALVPSAGDTAKPALWITGSTLLFALWHILETTFLPGSAATFLRPDFLLMATMLGLACAILRHRSGSIWTAITLHWLCVVAWQGFFGGPVFGR